MTWRFNLRMLRTFDRSIVGELLDRLRRHPPLIQIVVGPRQVGKTTAARTVQKRWDGPAHYAAADTPLPPGPEWIETHWQRARRAVSAGGEALLILDEIQKVPRWNETVKGLWDEDRFQEFRISVLLLGSSSLLLSEGTAESLGGRFYLNRCLHWSYPECQRVFGWDLDQWIYFGGYPGAAPLISEERTWRTYVADALIETVLARDVLAMQKVAKPVLLRHLFILASQFPAQVLSYNKMLGQLADAGNTTTLASYVRLLETAFLLSGLERYSPGRARSRGSSPKLVLWNNALVSALSLRSFQRTRSDSSWWGRLVENAVGAHLLNHLQALPYEVTYWRHRNNEVDYVIQGPQAMWAIEVKSGRPGALPGLAAFRRLHPKTRPLVVGSGGVPLEEFFSEDPRVFLE